MGERRTTRVVIVGAGFSGLGTAIQLKKAGIHDFVILEKADDVGGTWRENTYPGCECDVESHMYSFSYEQNARWSRVFSGQAEIWDYLRRLTEKHGLREHIRFGARVTGARWDDDAQQWQVSTESGDDYVGQFVANGVGVLHTPMIPRLKGIRQFQGEAWHSAEWNHDCDLAGKRVAVVGTGASAVQFVPRIASRVASLVVFQRTPPWILPKSDRAVPRWVQWLFANLPGTMRAYRYFLYWARELHGFALGGHPSLLKRRERAARRHLAGQVHDPALRTRLTPDYVLGCKRILLTNDFYPALNRDNVRVVTDGVTQVRANSVVDGAGVEHDADVIIYGTGFQPSLTKLKIQGRDGHSLWREWLLDGGRAHRGVMMSGYPNMFFLLGPNSGVAHTSVVFMIEAQAKFIVRAIKLVDARSVAAIDPRADTQRRFQTFLQDKLAKGVWATGGCTSYYVDDKGVNRTLWPGGTWRYWLQSRRLAPDEFELIARRPAARPADQVSVRPA
ncbi:MAG TPA: NAD(P)/FAD-dependent oxidoreductase [Pseudonocardiaceae bacterium]|jgi:cation diffusion facilitator CzcD-associated flavoprotein CzcO|nr:NAD(P)/FAD-dependent oxidoreductase [Pseudonocardiaceae bacterium]